MLFFLPAYAARPYNPRDRPSLVEAVLSRFLVYAVPALAGLIIGLFNIAQWFGFNPQYWGKNGISIRANPA